MASIATLEDLIISKLRSILPEVDTQPLPVDPADLGLPVTESQIYVAFESESFNPVEGGYTGRTYYQQLRKLRFQLILRLFELYGQQRSYDVLDTIRQALTGLGVEQRSRTGLYQVDGGFKQYAQGLWLYQMRFEIPTAYTQTNQ
jgi:Gp37 protein